MLCYNGWRTGAAGDPGASGTTVRRWSAKPCHLLLLSRACQLQFRQQDAHELLLPLLEVAGAAVRQRFSGRYSEWKECSRCRAAERIKEGNMELVEVRLAFGYFILTFASGIKLALLLLVVWRLLSRCSDAKNLGVLRHAATVCARTFAPKLLRTNAGPCRPSSRTAHRQ
jgi:hypothetical protein